jgi:DNA polymerase III delta subunit
MDLMSLKHQIMQNDIGHFYIFEGTEIGIQNIYLKEMSNKMRLRIVRADSVAGIYSKCTAKTLFGGAASIYAIRGDSDFMKAESLHATIERDIKDNVIVLMYDKIDSRTKFAKTFKDRTVMFDKLAVNVLKAYIKKSCNLSNYHQQELVDICTGSYDLCMLECDKINQYAQHTKQNEDYCMDELINNGVIYQPEESDVFEFVHEVCMHKVKSSFHKLQVLQSNGVSSINILGTLYNTMKNVLLIQVCEGKEISDITGLDSRQIYFNKPYVNKYSDGVLVYAVKLIIEVVSWIKEGKIDDSVAVKYVLINIM